MAQGPAIGYDVTVAERTPHASIEYNVEVTNAAREDDIRWALTVVNLLGVLSQSSRYIGAKIEIDAGDGVLSTLLKSEHAPEIRISGSLDGFGVRELSFTKIGGDDSPLRTAWLRGMRRVKVTGYRGTPGAIGEIVVFDGYLRDSDFSVYPRTANLTCQDASVAIIDQPLFYDLAPGAGKTRETIISEICAAASIPLGAVELLGTGGGTVYKGISEGGDRRVIEFLADFLVPVGCRPLWNQAQRVLDIRRYDTSRAAVRELTPGDILGSPTITPPPTNAPNVVAYSSAIFSYQGPGGRRTETKVDTKFTSYAPVVATQKQDKTTGTLSATGLTSTATVQKTSEIKTTTVYEGGSVVEQYVEEWGFYAPKACPKRQNTDGTIAHNSTFDAYYFPDGTWRSQERETWMIIRYVQLLRTFDADSGELRSETQWVLTHQPKIQPISSFTTATEVFDARLITDDGEAWENGVEQLIRDANGSAIENTAYVSVDGVVLFISRHRTGAGLWTRATRPTGSLGGLVTYGFGPRSAQRYGYAYSNTITVGPVSTTTYEVINEQSYRAVTKEHPDGTTVHGDRLAPLTPAGTVTYPGAPPHVEMLTDLQTAQSATVTVKDQVRIANSLNKEIPEYRENAYCESDAELRIAAIEMMRAIASPRVTISVPVDWVVKEGDVITATHPRFGHGAVTLLVRLITWSINTATGANEQVMECWWIPPELAAA